jgi:hypothetical protein
MPDLALLLLGYCSSESLLVFLQTVETCFDGLNGLFMQGEVREDNTFVYVCAGNRFVSILEVFIQKALLNL